MSTPCTSRRTHCFVHAIYVALVTFGLSALPAAAYAAGLDDKIVFDIPAQPLESALLRFSQQASVQLLTSSDELPSAQSKGVSGRLAVRVALTTLLQGTGLIFAVVRDGTIAIRPAGESSAATPVRATRLAQIDEDVRAAGPASATLTGAGQAGRATEAENASTEPVTLHEIVVTSTKLGAQRLGDVPVSITAIREEQIYRAGMKSFVDYARHVPGLGFQSLSAAGDRDDIRGGRRLNLRGIESGYDGVPTVAYYIDDAPIPVMDPKLFDIERIEVLRGPQGTLYGANSMGGAVRLVLNKPVLNESDYRGDVGLTSVSHGEEGYSTNQMVNVPLIEDALAIRAVGYYRFDGGYIDNVLRANPAGTQVVEQDINDEKSWGARLAATIQATDSLTITPSVFRQETRIDYGNEYTSSFQDLAVFNKRVATPERNDFTLYATEVRWTFGNWEIFSATSRFESTFDSVEDSTDYYYQFGITTPDEIARNVQEISSERFSEELRVSYKGARFGAVIGGFYLDEDRFFEQDFPRSYGDRSRPDFFYGTQANEEEQLAFFGEGSFKFTERFSATAGLRWFRGEQSQDTRFYNSGVLDEKPVISSSASSVSPKLQLSYKPGADKMIYVSATKGFRPGGPNAAVPLTSQGCPEALAELGFSEAPAEYEPDELWSYEVGSKLSFGRSATINVAAYSIDWTDVQQTVFLGAFATQECGFTFIGNVGKAKSEGVETELSLNVGERLTLSGAVGYTDSRFTRSNPSIGIEADDRLPLVPQWTASAGAQYTFSMPNGREGYLYADAAYRDKSLDGLSTHDLESYTTFNARLGTQLSGRLELVLFVDNLSDERAQLNVFRIPPTGPLPSNLLEQAISNRPRTVGLTLRYGF